MLNIPGRLRHFFGDLPTLLRIIPEIWSVAACLNTALS